MSKQFGSSMTNFKQMRILCGLTQKKLAEKHGVKPPTVAVLERKGCFDTRTAQSYAKTMGCNPVFLLEWLTISQQ